MHGRVSDIWRSYISQRLLWDVGYRVAFAPPLVNQYRSPHNYLADMQVRNMIAVCPACTMLLILTLVYNNKNMCVLSSPFA